MPLVIVLEIQDETGAIRRRWSRGELRPVILEAVGKKRFTGDKEAREIADRVEKLLEEQMRYATE